MHSFFKDGVFVDPVVAAMRHLPRLPDHVKHSLCPALTLSDKLKSDRLSECPDLKTAHDQDRGLNPIHHLARQHRHFHDAQILALEDPHVYFINGSCADVISCTTLVHAFFPEFDSKSIAQRTVGSKTFKSFSQKKKDHKYYGCETKEDVIAVWNKARDAGTELHNRIERFFNQSSDLTIATGLDPDPCWNQFMKLVRNPILWRFQPYRTEWAIYDPETRVAGKIDFVARDAQGRYYILDWKRTGKIQDKGYAFGGNPRECGFGVCSDFDSTNFWQYSLQLNIYQYILERYYDISIHRKILVQMHPELKSDRAQLILVPDLQRTVIRMMASRMMAMNTNAIALRSRGKRKPVCELSVH
jgi:ATP-dependent exoDNAse (exonuclease V) beta subunit